MSMTMKKLAAAGEVKKADLYKVRLVDLKVEEGFNLRARDSSLEEHIEALTQSILAGSFIPPLVVRAADDGSAVVVDGHCRREGYLRAVERGAEIEYISCVEFKGNDADRVAAIITSSQGKSLTPLEAAIGIKRLRAFGKSATEIAAVIGKTSNHVENLLLLADSNSDVQKAVASGQIAASTAIDLVRKHGEQAGKVIEAAAEKAKGEGKAKVTPRMVEQKLPPKKVMTSIYDRVRAISQVFPAETVESMESMDDTATVTVNAKLLAGLLKAYTGDLSKVAA